MKRFITLFLLLVLFALSGPFTTVAQRPDAPTYGQRGPHTVGTREFTITDEERPLNVTVWYPALNQEYVEETTLYNLVMIFNVEGQAIRDAEPASEGAPYPLIVFSHGSGASRYLSLFYTEHLASHGFVVIATDHVGNTVLEQLQLDTLSANIPPSYIYRPADVLRLIDYAETLTTDDGALAGMIDTDRIAVTGHSFGGYTAMAIGGARINFDSLNVWCDSNTGDPDTFDMSYNVCFMRDYVGALAELRGLDTPPEGAWPATNDSRIRAIVALAPWNGPLLDMELITAPTMIMVGTGDTVTLPERDAYLMYGGITNAPRTLVTLENADHYIFIDSCPDMFLQLGYFSVCSDSVWDMQRSHDLINHFATAFFLATLKDDVEAAGALAADAVNFVGVGYEVNGE